MPAQKLQQKNYLLSLPVIDALKKIVGSVNNAGNMKAVNDTDVIKGLIVLGSKMNPNRIKKAINEIIFFQFITTQKFKQKNVRLPLPIVDALKKIVGSVDSADKMKVIKEPDVIKGLIYLGSKMNPERIMEAVNETR